MENRNIQGRKKKIRDKENKKNRENLFSLLHCACRFFVFYSFPVPTFILKHMIYISFCCHSCRIERDTKKGEEEEEEEKETPKKRTKNQHQKREGEREREREREKERERERQQKHVFLSQRTSNNTLGQQKQIEERKNTHQPTLPDHRPSVYQIVSPISTNRYMTRALASSYHTQ